MRCLGRRRIVFAMPNPASGGHALSVTGPDYGTGPQAILVLEFARQDVGDDLHVAVGVRRKARAGPDKILIDHTQRAEAHPLLVPVVAEAESVARLEPAVVAASAF